ncbi:unnamed protein product [Euphydryas editha]|uniref:Tc1-like transposase DDE domain-containing protein n=1 Tax=Euphydryas editha TaxID=104508 RepID=A0AAU9UYL6_EUPED|nr:unnamed protein product [Euphydryas editha]
MSKGKTYRGGDRNIILKVVRFFEKEKQNGSPIIPVQRALDRASEATGVSIRTLRNIKNEAKKLRSTTPTPGTSADTQEVKLNTPKKKKPSGKKLEIDDFVICAIRNIVESFYSVKKEIPTLEKILNVAKTELNFPGQKTTLRKILKEKLSYKFKKFKNIRDFLVQKPDRAAWRAKYLRRLKENDELGADKKLVTYVDETWVHSDYTVAKCWQNSLDASVKNNFNPAQRWIIVHAGNENGFIQKAGLIYKCKSSTGDYHSEMNTGNFIKWLNEKLIPNLPSNGIVIIDNAPYHNEQIEKRPNYASLKEDMQNWLRDQNVTYEENMTKKELYQIIKVSLPSKKYIVDELLKSHGHEVLRLPPYHCDLNPMEYVWNLIKKRVADKYVTQSEKDIIKLTQNAIKSITPSDWKKEVNGVDRLRRKYWESDRLGEIYERELLISVGQNSDSDYTELESDTESDSVMSDLMDFSD